MVVALDGPGGAGKSTVTRLVAEELGLPFLDTGATYRAATVAVLRAGVDPGDGEAVAAVVDRIEIGYEDGVVHLDGEPVGDATRSSAVTAAVSAVSAHPAVRETIVAMQRTWVAERGGRAVVEGRDIGTTVFPDAAVKVFLTARPEVRAARRAGDAETRGASVAAIAADLDRRDRYDASRETSPMQAADDAVALDTSDLDIDAVVDAVLSLVEAAASAARYEGT